MANIIKNFLKNFLNKVKRIFLMYTSKEGTLFTNSFAFSFTFGMAPLIFVIVLIFSKYIISADAISGFLSNYIPQEFVFIFIDYIKEITLDNLIAAIVMLMGALWVASQSIYSLMLFDDQYHVKQTPKIILRLLSVAILVIVILTIGMLVLFTENVNEKHFQINDFTHFVFLFIVLLIMYRFIFIRSGSFKIVYQGAMFCAFGIMIMGKVFFSIVYNYTNYSTIYGPMASIMFLLLSNYVIASLVYAGYCINKINREAEDLEEIHNTEK